MKRWLFLVHRWAGVVLCLFMAMWFVSGVVMMYVGYPKLTTQERLAVLPTLAPDGCCTMPSLDGEPHAVRLTTVGGEPRFIVEGPGRGSVRAFDARTGAPIGPVTPEQSRRAAQAFAGPGPLRHHGRVAEDAWTHSKALEAHRPMDVFETGSGTLLYVSTRTGEVVRDATRTERLWNWAGAWIHWLYPFRGGSVDAAWHDIVVWSSVAGTVLAITGVVVGVWRWRFRGTYKTGSHSPYRGAWFRWHHIAGLIFGVLTVTWIFSGLMSMNPWKVFDSRAPRLDATAYAGGPLSLTEPSVSVPQLLARLSADGLTPRELHWRRIAGRMHVIGHDGIGTRLLAVDGATAPLTRLPQAALLRDATRLLPGATIRAHEVLEAYDTYYYGRAPHTMGGHLDRRLPMLRVMFDDPHDTWVHLDPFTGEVLGRLDRLQRTKRWLFAFLHSFDWWPLLAARPLWDLLLIVGSLGGLTISATGVWMGWRRLRWKWLAATRGTDRRAAPSPSPGHP